MTDNCFIDLRGLVGEKLSDELVTRIDQEYAAVSKADPSKPKGLAYAEAAEIVGAQMKEESSRFKQQLVTQAAASKNWNTLYDELVKTGTHKDRAVAQAIGIYGDSAIAAAEKAKGRFVHDYQKADLAPIIQRLSKEDELAVTFLTEIRELNTPGGKAGITGNKQVAELAGIFQKHVDFYRMQLKELGFKVVDLQGRMLKQVWDTDRMLQAVKSAQEFADIIYPKLRAIGDVKITDMSEEKAKEILSEFYDIKVGRVIDAGSARDSIRNMKLERQTYAARQAESRELHFSSPEDSYFVLKTFGSGDLVSLMAETIRDLGKQVDATRNMGVNPRANAAVLIEHAVNVGKADYQQIEGGWTLTQKPQYLLNTIDGFYDNNTANPHLSELVDTVHNFARAKLLAMASLSALGDFATLAAANRRLGIQRASSIASSVKALFNDLPPAVQREAAGIVETQAVHALGTAHRYITLPGMNHKLYNASVYAVDKTFELNGLNKLTRKNKQTAYVGYSNLLARQLDEKAPYASLDAYAKRTLLRGGITETDWNKLLEAPNATVQDGNLRFVNTDALNPKMAAKVSAALSAFVNEAVITPNVQTRTRMNMGLQRGTAAHAIIQQMTFILGYPIAFLSQGIGRQVEATGFVSGPMLTFAAALTFTGIVQQVLRDVGNARDRDYDDPEVALDLIQRGLIAGGGLTIIGENLWKATGTDRAVHHLFFGGDGEYPPQSKPFNPSELLVGAGTEYLWNFAKGTGKTTWAALTGDFEGAVGNLAKTGQAALPFVSLPLVKPIVDATFFDYFIELADPDHYKTAERKWHSRTGGDFLLTDFEP